MSIFYSAPLSQEPQDDPEEPMLTGEAEIGRKSQEGPVNYLSYATYAVGLA